MAKHPGVHTGLLRGLITLLLLGLLVWVGVKNADKLHASLVALRAARWQFVVLAMLFLGLTFLLAAGIYQLLAQKKLQYKQMVLIEIAAAAVNRTLPSGLGALGLHGVYLYKQKHSTAQATAVVSVNNLLGIAAHMLLLSGVILFSPGVLNKFSLHHSTLQLSWLPVVATCVLAILLLTPAVRRRLTRFMYNLLISVRSYMQQPHRLLLATLLAVALTATYTGVLCMCARALHVQLPVLECFVVFSIGMLVGTATPTPGGLVGAEAGLFAGFVAYGISAPAALATTLLFRLLTYWLPLLPGALALLHARRLKII